MEHRKIKFSFSSRSPANATPYRTKKLNNGLKPFWAGNSPLVSNTKITFEMESFSANWSTKSNQEAWTKSTQLVEISKWWKTSTSKQINENNFLDWVRNYCSNTLMLMFYFYYIQIPSCLQSLRCKWSWCIPNCRFVGG